MDDFSDSHMGGHINKKPKRVNHNELERKAGYICIASC